MDKLIINVSEPYPIYFDNSYDGLRSVLEESGLFSSGKARKIFIVSDSNVAPLYLNAVKKSLNDAPDFVFPAGESSKNMDTLQNMYKSFLRDKLDRRSLIVALGGGVVGDMVGFAAATFMRGVDFVILPTTLLAQVDAGVGGKTAIDFEGVKNLIGAFHQPRLVYMNLSALKTLPKEEFISGMGEVIKHGLIGSTEYYEYLHKHREDIKKLVPEVMKQVVAGSCKIKAAVVAADEKENNLREILNFGHCVGHAIESLSEYSIPHGCCVAIGMHAALMLSDVPVEEIDRAVNLMNYFGLPTSCTDFCPDEILQTMYMDKKTINDTIRIVLLKKIGEAYTDSSVSPNKIKQILSAF